MSDTVTLPSHLTTQNIVATIKACSDILSSFDEVLIDARQLLFVDPIGITLLGSTLFQTKNLGIQCTIKGLKLDVGSYLNRMDCFNDVTLADFNPPSYIRHDRRDSLVELRQISEQSKVDEIAYDLAKALIGAFHEINSDEPPDEMTGFTTTDHLIEPIQYSLSELLENSLTHARKYGNNQSSVWVAGQYFPRKGIVKIAVTDNGCGFLGSLKDHSELQNNTHLGAILTAMKPRVSCNRDLGIMNDSVNQGVGLTTTIRIAQETGGRAVIISGNATHSTEGISNDMGDTAWKGVAISLEFSRHRLSTVKYRNLLPILDATPEINLRFE